MKKIIWIVAVLLLVGFCTSLLPSLSSPEYKEPSVNRPSGDDIVVPPADDPSNKEEPPVDSGEDTPKEYEVLWSGEPDFTKTIYEPNLAQVPSFYWTSDDYDLTMNSIEGFAGTNVFYSSLFQKEFYGDTLFHLNLPNYSSGKYVYSITLQTNGKVPTHMDVYLKSPGYLNQVNLLDIDNNIYNMGLDFAYQACANISCYQFSIFKLDFEFDFDEDIVEVYVTDVNDTKVLLTTNSIELLREYTYISKTTSTQETANTKELPIIIRFQISEKDNYEVGGEDVIYFSHYSFKKQINI